MHKLPFRFPAVFAILIALAVPAFPQDEKPPGEGEAPPAGESKKVAGDAAEAEKSPVPSPVRLPVASGILNEKLAQNFEFVSEGKKIGEAKGTLGKNEAGDAFVSRFSMTLEMPDESGDAKKVEIDEEQVFDLARPHELLSANATVKSADGEQKISVKRLRTMHYEAKVPGEEEPQEWELDYTLADELAPRLWVRSNPKVGDRISHRALTLSQGAYNLRVLEIKSVEDGKFTVVEETAGTGEKSEAILDAAGRLISSDMGNITIRDVKAAE
ncbi:MAG: hypothetical protein R3F11_01880 [Verrucomicrobiales bacterium]